MSWKPVRGGEWVWAWTRTGYLWVYDSMFDTVDLVYVGSGDVFLDDLDPDYTHWMYDGESSEEPSPPEDN